MDTIQVNHDPKGWGPDSIKFPQIPRIDPTDELDRLYSFIDFGQKPGKYDDDHNDFALVDNKLQSKTKILSRHGLYQPKSGLTQKNRQVTVNRVTTVQRVASKRIYREQTVVIRSNWNIIAEISKPINDKMSFDPGNAEDISQFGHVLAYKKNQELAITTLKPKLLNTKNIDSKGFITTTTSNDPIIESLKDRASIFITDSVLVTIMTMNRSVYPWDIQIRKENGKIYFDKSEDPLFEQLSMNENNPEHMPDEDEPETSLNNPKRLSEEALRINRSFFLSSIGEPSFEFGPAIGEDTVPIAFKYRKWQLSENVSVLVRTEVDSFIEEADNSKVFVKLFAVNEYDAKITGGYKEKLENKKGQVFANEIKNNSCKMSKWALKAMLAGVDVVKIGYACRVTPTTADKHHLVYVHKIKTQYLMQNLNLAYNNCWGIFKSIVDIVRREPDGKYVMVKDPMKPVVRLFSAIESNLTEEFENR